MIQDNVEKPVYNHLNEIIQEGATSIIPSLESKNITFVNKHVNEVNKVLKSIPVHNLTDLKNVPRAGVLLVYKNVRITGDQNKKAKGPIWKRKKRI